jgi:hypothetical protein
VVQSVKLSERTQRKHSQLRRSNNSWRAKQVVQMGRLSSNFQTLALLHLAMSNKKNEREKKDGDRFLVHVGRSQPSEIGFTVNTHG